LIHSLPIQLISFFFYFSALNATHHPDLFSGQPATNSSIILDFQARFPLPFPLQQAEKSGNKPG